MLDPVTIHVEIWQTNPPKPGGFGLMRHKPDGSREVIGVLTLEEVKAAVAEYEAMAAASTRP
jgi:hypothetical protein